MENSVDSLENSVENSPCFYAVFIRRGTEENGSSAENGNSMVFTELKLAIKFMESNKGKNPRFRKFRNLADAEKFCQNGPGLYEPANFQDEPQVEFPSPKRSELVELEKFIRNNEMDRVELLIESNPCYLINAKIGDSPTVLKEGCNWNALHIAARNGNSEICRLILEKLNDSRYCKIPNKHPNNMSLIDNQRNRLYLTSQKLQ